MANELQTVLPPFLNTYVPDVQRKVAVGINNLVANNKIDHLHLNIPLSDVPPPLLTLGAQGINFNRDYYNLFVWGADLKIEHLAPFKVDSDRALTEFMDSNIKEMFSTLEDASTVQKVLSFPCLFANENRRSGRADADQTVGFGYIKQIKVRRNGVMIYPHVIYRLPQQRINEALFELDLHGNSSYNEFNRSHWSIKKIDLIAELIDMGFPLYEVTNGKGYAT